MLTVALILTSFTHSHILATGQPEHSRPDTKYRQFVIFAIVGEILQTACERVIEGSPHYLSCEHLYIHLRAHII